MFTLRQYCLPILEDRDKLEKMKEKKQIHMRDISLNDVVCFIVKMNSLYINWTMKEDMYLRVFNDP